MNIRTRSALLALALIGIWACSDSSAKTPPAPPKQTTICGTIDTLWQRRMGLSSDTYTIVKFDDGRAISLIGIPEVTVTKGKYYAFTINDTPWPNGAFHLQKTEATPICGYDRDTTAKKPAAKK